MVNILPSLPLFFPGAGASTASEGRASAAGAVFTGISNLARAAASVLQAVGTGLQHVGRQVAHAFESIQNRFAAKPQDASSEASATGKLDSPLSALGSELIPGLLQAAESTLTRVLPILIPQLQGHEVCCDDLRDAFRAKDTVPTNLKTALSVNPELVPQELVEQVEAFAEPERTLAGGESRTAVWNRINTGGPVNDAFLQQPEVRTAILEDLDELRSLTARFMDACGQTDRARRLEAFGGADLAARDL